MSVKVPASLDELVAVLTEQPDSELLAGGTDLMVEVNFGRRRPSSVVSVTAVPELAGFSIEGDDIVLGGALTYTEMLEAPLAHLLPGLAQAARTVGSPQIRNAGTIGGNLATASPAGDTLPVLLALGARIAVVSADGRRELSLAELVTGPKRTVLGPYDVIHSVLVPRRLGRASQEFVKVGTRNAMVIAVCSAALVVDWEERAVRVGLGSVGPVPLRAPEAEAFAAEAIDWASGLEHEPGEGRTVLAGRAARSAWRGGEAALDEFARLVARAAAPIDDHRSTAAYRRHAVGTCARRALARATGEAPSLEGAGAERARPPRTGRPAARPRAAAASGAARAPSVGELDECSYRLSVNGRELEVESAWMGESLLYVLRNRLGLLGAKNACEQGECGSCSVLVDGELVCACLVLAATALGQEIVTVEGLGGESLSDVQEAFLAEGAVQCGFCTPGLVVSVHDLLERNPDPSDLEVREAISGNLCRCTGYGRILAAVEAAKAARLAGAGR